FFISYIFHSSGAHRALHSFPTRRSSDLVGTIRSSLFGATDAAGVPYGVARQMIDILSSDVDFFRDLRAGDQFRVIYESFSTGGRSEEHTSELQSRENLVCRLLLEKKHQT